MNPVLLIDFGSTFTKAAAVDTDSESIIAAAESFTTAATDINAGLEDALSQIRAQTGLSGYAERYACSSAAGGLRMAACGLVPELTAQAAKTAALGAGAKVIKLYSYKLTKSDIAEIDSLRPDIFLLTGGTDGGNAEYITHNAGMLSRCEAGFPVILAGNRGCAEECREALNGREVHAVENVMPAFGAINVAPAQEKIREIFLRRIILAKGLSKAEKLISGILMPTPAAILEAVGLLSRDLGELMCVDLGGATTDVYSMAAGAPASASTVVKGLAEPFAKRTVEGDIGMRHSVYGILAAAGEGKIAELSGLSAKRINGLCGYLAENAGRLPDTPELKRLDSALAAAAVRIGVERHAGTLEKVYTPMGEAFSQTGKDLRHIETMVLTGGALIHAGNAPDIIAAALGDENPVSLSPKRVNLLLDKKYILAAMGLLSRKYPEQAARIMKKELVEYVASKQKAQ